MECFVSEMFVERCHLFLCRSQRPLVNFYSFTPRVVSNNRWLSRSCSQFLEGKGKKNQHRLFQGDRCHGKVFPASVPPTTPRSSWRRAVTIWCRSCSPALLSAAGPGSRLQCCSLHCSTACPIAAPRPPLQHCALRCITTHPFASPRAPLQHRALCCIATRSVAAPHAPLQHRAPCWSATRSIAVPCSVAASLFMVQPLSPLTGAVPAPLSPLTGAVPASAAGGDAKQTTLGSPGQRRPLPAAPRHCR